MDSHSYYDNSWNKQVPPLELSKYFSDFLVLKDVFQEIKSLKKWGLFDYPILEEWYKNRVLLLGDACHPILPYLAQGASQAIEDSYVLYQCI